jgi:MFS family permease
MNLGLVSRLRSIPPLQRRNIWSIAWMCFFWSVASVMIFSLLPLFLTETLGVSKTSLGFIEGVSVFFAFVAKIVTGLISDYIKKRKSIIVFGNILTVLVKPLFALSYSMCWVFTSKTLDRLSKGIRSAPTDALISAWSDLSYRGTSYGVREALYITGSVVGALGASWIYQSTQSYRFVFGLAVLPAFCALLISIFFVQESPNLKVQKRAWSFRDLSHLPSEFWILLGASFFLMLARFSESFLALRAKEVGIDVHQIPLLFAAYEVTRALVALPTGHLSDQMNRYLLLIWGILILTIANGVCMLTYSFGSIAFGFVLVGFHMGVTQGLLSTLISQHTLEHLRGTAFSAYYLTSGVAVLIGNQVAGVLSDWWGTTQAAFLGGLIFTTLSICVLIGILQNLSKNRSQQLI